MRHHILRGLFIATLIVGSSVIGGTPLLAQSFDCRYAEGAVQVLICKDDQASFLHELMANVYLRVERSGLRYTIFKCAEN